MGQGRRGCGGSGLDLYGIPFAVMEAGMATKATVTLVGDLDGGPAEETARLGFGGAEYEIDLNASKARAFRQQLAPLSNTRNTGRRRGEARTGSRRAHGRAIRAAAQQQGIAVTGRGRLRHAPLNSTKAAARDS